jgi:hypothetical protein
MSDILVRIKRAVLDGRYEFSEKASLELEADNLTARDVVESIVTAVAIHKVLRSTSPRRVFAGEKLYVIIGTNMDGLPIYTKGKLVSEAGVETFYFLISTKRAAMGD